MGVANCRRLISKDDSWQYRRIVWDGHAKKTLGLVPGEQVYREFTNVEDCIKGVLGTLRVTTLRFIWTSNECKSEKSKVPKSSFSIGLQCVDCVHFNVTDSESYGRCRCVSVSTTFNNEKYEFGLAVPQIDGFTMFSLCENWHKRFKSTRVFRETLIREHKMTKKGLFIPHWPEEVVMVVEKVDNIAAAKKYTGKVFVTTHRFVWVSSRTSVVNASIPFSQMKMVQVRATNCGIGLIMASCNVSCSRKPTHFPDPNYGEIVLGFRIPSVNELHSISEFCNQKVKEFKDDPYYMPHDGRVCYKDGHWTVVSPPMESDVSILTTIGGTDGIMDGDIRMEISHGAAAMTLDSDDRSVEPLANSHSDDGDLLTTPPMDEDMSLINSSGFTRLPTLFGDVAGRNEWRKKREDDAEAASPAARPYKCNKSQSRAGSSCVVCLHNHAELAFDPCGHICCCNACGPTLKECPMCRQQITKSLRIFMIA